MRPDIVLLNEFDYFADPGEAVLPFLQRYLAQGQGGQRPLDYPYFYSAPVNTGVPSGFDLNRDGRIDDKGQDAFGYGLYPGHYGMLLLSRFPLVEETVRTFRLFRWRDMPDNLMQSMRTPDGEPWYDDEVQAVFRLSSKSHWDVQADIQGQRVHLLASHPTPPVFDGPEDRNGRRNHDEIRFWVDYLSGAGSGAAQADYIVDDQGGRGGLRGERFVILGDLNASPVEGDARSAAIRALVAHPGVNDEMPPTSAAAAARSPVIRMLPATRRALHCARITPCHPAPGGLSPVAVFSGLRLAKPEPRWWRIGRPPRIIGWCGLISYWNRCPGDLGPRGSFDNAQPRL